MGMRKPGANQNQDDAAKKAAADAAAAEAAAKAKAEADAQGGNHDDAHDDLDDSTIGKLDEATQGYIKKLRGESAKYRTKAKELEGKHTALEGRFSQLETGIKKAFGLEDDKSTPEEKLAAIEQQNAALQFKTAIQEMAIDHGMNSQQSKYFQFLLSERASEMEEGQEIGDEDMEKLVTQAKAVGAASGQNGGNGDTSPKGNGKGGKAPAPGGQGDTVTAEQFSRMNTGEKSVLFQKDPTLYQSLLTEAKSKKLI